MQALKNWLKQHVIPKKALDFVRPFYHGGLAILASLIYGNPSGKMMVIGITGTTGKSTTAQMLARILNFHPPSPPPYQGGEWGGCGFITTISFFDGQREYLNKHGLSMPGGFLLQKQLRQMQKNGCACAIVECTSEGLKQNRHLGVNFDMAIFTNLSPAHVEAHGGLENYKLAKGRLFKTISKSQIPNPKQISNLKFQVPKTIIINADDEAANYFASFPAGKVIKFGIKNQQADFVASPVQAGERGIEFVMQNVNFQIPVYGQFNAGNAGLAAVAADALGINLKVSAQALAAFRGAPGRMELIENTLGVKVFVDYGCEPESFKAALLAAQALPHKKLIHVFGSTGGHRDKAKRFLFGKISAELADEIIVTNDDVYDSDPQKIAENIQAGIKEAIKNLKLKIKNYQIVLDRRQAIGKALSIAQPKDIVLITGKGSEQFLILPGNKRIEWDDRQAVREELSKFRKLFKVNQKS